MSCASFCFCCFCCIRKRLLQVETLFVSFVDNSVVFLIEGVLIFVLWWAAVVGVDWRGRPDWPRYLYVIGFCLHLYFPFGLG